MKDAEEYVLSLAGKFGNTADGNALMLVYEELARRRRRRESLEGELWQSARLAASADSPEASRTKEGP